MARILKFDLERLGAEVSVEREFEASGIKLTWPGKDVAGTCSLLMETIQKGR